MVGNGKEPVASKLAPEAPRASPITPATGQSQPRGRETRYA